MWHFPHRGFEELLVTRQLWASFSSTFLYAEFFGRPTCFQIPLRLESCVVNFLLAPSWRCLSPYLAYPTHHESHKATGSLTLHLKFRETWKGILVTKTYTWHYSWLWSPCCKGWILENSKSETFFLCPKIPSNFPLSFCYHQTLVTIILLSSDI
jgi:hypothetical protein